MEVVPRLVPANIGQTFSRTFLILTVWSGYADISIAHNGPGLAPVGKSVFLSLAWP